jgi:N-acetylmuramoyl-L-alanine amidase/putative cell wall-binding protein
MEQVWVPTSTRTPAPPVGTGVRVLALMLAALLLWAAWPAPAALADGPLVYIDAGHGGKYPGATYSGVREKDVNLWLALETERRLKALGYDVGMTRRSDVTLCSWDVRTWHFDDEGTFYYADGVTAYSHGVPIDDLQRRVDLANNAGADVYLSIHNNAAGSSARGTETYHNWDNAADTTLSRQLASYVQQEVVRSTGARDRGVKDVGFYVIRWANMPAILIKAGFLSNSQDRALLLSPTYRGRVAQGIAQGIARFLAGDPFTPVHERLAGSDRYTTATSAARDAWPSGAETVILATGEDWPDSLAATPLSTELDAPVLLTYSKLLPGPVASALRDLAPSEIVVLGGTDAVSADVADAAAAAAGIPPGAVRRLAGADRYETACMIAAEVGLDSRRVVVVSGATFADAISASPYAGMTGAPILLAPPAALATCTADALADSRDQIDEVVIVGGTAAVDDLVGAELSGVAPVRRIAGANRYETSLAMAETFWPSGDISPFVASAERFPDALIAGSLAAHQGEPILLTGRKFLHPRTREYLVNADPRIESFTMVGGPSSLSYLMDWQLIKARR